MKKQYNVGDKVWYAKCQSQEITKPCPVCFGKLEVKLTLGNGDDCILPCNYCGKGWELPRGFVTEYEYIAEPELWTITGCNIEESCSGQKRRYKSGAYVLYDEDIFDTVEEATERCAQRIEKLYEDQRTRAEYLKKDVNKNFSWNAGYHMRQAKRDRESAARHEEKARICKERARV